jgi:hypothetical protein
LQQLFWIIFENSEKGWDICTTPDFANIGNDIIKNNACQENVEKYLMYYFRAKVVSSR